MRTDLECMACFLNQALATARLCSDDPQLHRRIVNETGTLLPSLNMQISTPENAVAVYGLIADISGVTDPFQELKNESNSLALSLRKKVRERIISSSDPLHAAVRYAIAGNIIDYGAQHSFDAMQTLSKCLEEDLLINDYDKLQKELRAGKQKNILYLADNCGEIVFDGLLIEQLQELGHTVTLVVRGDSIINDATMHDVSSVEVDSICRVITNGTSCPGTPLQSASDELRRCFYETDLVISKGQGNFETLSEEKGLIYFLLTVKCPVVAHHIEALKRLPSGTLSGNGEMILMHREE